MEAFLSLLRANERTNEVFFFEGISFNHLSSAASAAAMASLIAVHMLIERSEDGENADDKRGSTAAAEAAEDDEKRERKRSDDDDNNEEERHRGRSSSVIIFHRFFALSFLLLCNLSCLFPLARGIRARSRDASCVERGVSRAGEEGEPASERETEREEEEV